MKYNQVKHKQKNRSTINSEQTRKAYYPAL